MTPTWLYAIAVRSASIPLSPLFGRAVYSKVSSMVICASGVTAVMYLSLCLKNRALLFSFAILRLGNLFYLLDTAPTACITQWHGPLLRLHMAHAMSWPHSFLWGSEFTADPTAFLAAGVDALRTVTVRLGSVTYECDIQSNSGSFRANTKVTPEIEAAAAAVQQMEQDDAAAKVWMNFAEALITAALEATACSSSNVIAQQYKRAGRAALKQHTYAGMNVVTVTKMGSVVGRFAYLNVDSVKELLEDLLAFRRVSIGTVVSPGELLQLLGKTAGGVAQAALDSLGYAFVADRWLSSADSDGDEVVPVVPMLFVDGSGQDSTLNLCSLKLPNVQGIQLPALAVHPYTEAQLHHGDVEQIMVFAMVVVIQQLSAQLLKVESTCVQLTPLMLRCDMLAVCGCLGIKKYFRAPKLPLHEVPLQALHSDDYATPQVRDQQASHATPALRFAQWVYPQHAMATDVAPYCGLHVVNAPTGSLLASIYSCCIAAGVTAKSLIDVAPLVMTAPSFSTLYCQVSRLRHSLRWGHENGGRYESHTELALLLQPVYLWQAGTVIHLSAEKQRAIYSIFMLWSSMLRLWHTQPLMSDQQKFHCLRCCYRCHTLATGLYKAANLPVPSTLRVFKWRAILQHIFVAGGSAAALGPLAGYSCENLMGPAQAQLVNAHGSVQHAMSAAQILRRLAHRKGIRAGEATAESVLQYDLGSSIPRWWGCVVHRPLAQTPAGVVSAWIVETETPERVKMQQGEIFSVGDFVSVLRLVVEDGVEPRQEWQLAQVMTVSQYTCSLARCDILTAHAGDHTAVYKGLAADIAIPPGHRAAGTVVMVPKGTLPVADSAIEQLGKATYSGHPILSGWLPTVIQTGVVVTEWAHVVQREYVVAGAPGVFWWLYGGMYNPERPEK